MTEQQARRELKAWRLQKRWSFEQLAFDMHTVLGRNTVSIRTLSRFEAGSHRSHQYTIADVADYLKAAKKRAA